MEWSNEMALQLIDAYKKYPLLWNTKDPYHFSRSKKMDAWESIGASFGMPAVHVKQKISSLLGSFRREKAKGASSIRTGKARKAVYNSKWFAFERMSFLLDKDKPRTTVDTNKVKENYDEESSTQQPLPDVDPLTNSASIMESDSSSNQSPTTPVPPKRRRRVSERKDDGRLEKAFQILNTSLPWEQPDECDTYGKHVANKLRSYSNRTRVRVEHAINNILFEADMGNYEAAA
ncbi:uncharacterized protein LOC128872351 isoform X1 [Hylaeus volcanicus]|uniref:uncharacterized protein LOC128872351 isoform X1 n=2 Tax=Hylaeus volcanicus TaxID=313075 RepID=UPI0023B85FDD|nr:uncharacterized protein LOC128872351 isoform X1 [Hylaeus volcanicus]